MLPTPRALLLDFGGVIVESPRAKKDLIEPRVAHRVRQLIGDVFTEDEILAELVRADQLRSHLRDNSEEGDEFSHRQLWTELVAAEWPEAARERVVEHATELTYLWSLRPSWRLRPGIADLLDYTVGQGLPVAVVSNTRSGQAHRDTLDRLGVTPAFALQIYSDELGKCKPHPKMIWAAVRELDVPTWSTWFVGDQVRKDIVCARRAGCGAAILMPEGEPVAREDLTPDETPDATVADGNELLKLLKGVREQSS